MVPEAREHGNALVAGFIGYRRSHKSRLQIRVYPTLNSASCWNAGSQNRKNIYVLPPPLSHEDKETTIYLIKESPLLLYLSFL